MSSEFSKPLPSLHGICKQCGTALYHPVTDQSNDYPACQSCIQRELNISIFFCHNAESNQLASPNFGSAIEAQQFASIFGLNTEKGYRICGIEFYIYPLQSDDAEPSERTLNAQIAYGKQLLSTLQNQSIRERFPGDAGLLHLAKLNGLSRYKLPIFESVETEIA